MPALDGVRGLAILLVMVFHFVVADGGAEHGADAFVLGLASVGWAGVDLFFVLSGFLITGILLDEHDAPHYLRNFFGRRVLRIFPLYFAALVVWIVIAPRFASRVPELALPDGSAPWVWAHASNIYLTIVQDFSRVPFGTGHFWSLSIEEQFYILWPFLVWKLDRATLIRVCLAAFALAEATRVLAVFGFENPIAAYTLLPARIDALAAGALVAILWREPGGMVTLHRGLRALLWPSIVILGVVVAWRGTAVDWLHAYDPWVQTLAYPALTALSALLIISVIRAEPGAPSVRYLTTPWLGGLGRYSYGLYVIHVPLTKIAKRLVVPSGVPPALAGSRVPFQIAFVLALLVASLAMAWLSYHGFERHFLRLKRYFRPRAVA